MLNDVMVSFSQRLNDLFGGQISGINEHEVDIKELAKKLKNKLACGGTGKNGVIALQGDHMRSVKETLVELGFSPDTIDVHQSPRPMSRPRSGPSYGRR